MKSNKLFPTVSLSFLRNTVIFLLSLVFILCYFLYKEYSSQNCYTEKEETVRGISMEPLIHDGDKVKALLGYYNCHNIEREDVILADYPGDRENLILKKVRAIPGDTISLIKNEGLWNILVNDKYLTNSAGLKYSLTDSRAQDLRNNERDYQGKIPARQYLVLGEMTEGSMDSTRSGLFSREMMVAKVELEK